MLCQAPMAFPCSACKYTCINDLGKTQSRVLDQAQIVTPGPLEEMLNFIDSTFLQQLAFDNLSICAPVAFAYNDTLLAYN